LADVFIGGSWTSRGTIIHGDAPMVVELSSIPVNSMRDEVSIVRAQCPLSVTEVKENLVASSLIALAIKILAIIV
jgi:hypothetical protein